jgi:tetratricopeptide (TPR) repeat protein
VAYKNGDYQKAIDSWEQILETGQHSAAVYFNMGNAYYKLNEIGPSIYYYEKALQLAPSDRDIKNNLAFAENARIDAIEPLPKTIFRVWYERISGVFAYDGWATVAITLSFLSALLFLWYFFSRNARQKRVAFLTSIGCGLLMMGSLVMAFVTYGEDLKKQFAIVFSSQVEVRNEPTVRGEAVFILHEGTKVQVLDREGDWARISIADGKDGWLLHSAVKEL